MYKEKFLHKFARWLLRDQNNDCVVSQDFYGSQPAISSNKTRLDRSDGTINFTIHPASGGYVVETYFYDRKLDDHKRNLHIITSQEDFSEELGKAVFMDLLKNR